MFESPHFLVRELGQTETPRIQDFFEKNPEYFRIVKGRAPQADEAATEHGDLPPAHLGFSRRWFGGVFDRRDEMIGVMGVVADLAAAQVWHIALFIVATHLHGQGVGSEVFAALEQWAGASGARWLRLGVVDDNAPAWGFWAKCGFSEVRRRQGIETGGRRANVVVMVKALGGATLREYLAVVPRDQPDSTLA